MPAHSSKEYMRAWREKNRERVRLQSIWGGILSRCYNPGNRSYRRYGGRGITVCQRWRESFAAFADDMGSRPPDCSLDRRDNDGHYTPENCRWATQKEQARNRATGRILEHNGMRRTVAEWAEVTGLSRHVIEARIDQSGWPIAAALETPKVRYRRGGLPRKAT